MEIRIKHRTGQILKALYLGFSFVLMLSALVSCSQKKAVLSVPESVAVDDAKHNIQLRVSMQTDSILLGDQFELCVEAYYPKGLAISYPDFDSVIVPGIEVLEASVLESPKSKDPERELVKLTYLLTSFDSGSHVLPVFPLLVSKSEQERDTVLFNLPFVLKVGNIALADDFKPYDIKDVLAYPSEVWKTIVLIAIIVLILLVALWFILGRERLRKILPLGDEPLRDPYELAVESLQKLKADKLWEQGRTKEYYSMLTDIVRQYIEHRTNMPAMEKTSEEILAMLPQMQLGDVEVLERYLKELFYIADLAKFAKFIPNEADNELCWHKAYGFVEQTKVQPRQAEDSDEEVKANE